MVYRQAEQIDFTIETTPPMPLPRRVLMVSSDHFDVEYVINPHMEGHVGQVDRALARRQWEALRDTYRTLGFEVHVLDGVPGLPDMVFCANQTLPFLRGDGERGVVLSRMHAPQRRDEVPHIARFFEQQGYALVSIPDEVPGSFEGMGDALWHPGHALLWGGYGFRTDQAVYEWLARELGVRVVALHLTDPDFYHLDTCLSLLDAGTALYVPAAFDEAGRALLHRLIPNLIEVPEREARELLACNAHCPDGRHVLIQQGCTETVARLRAAGFEPIELDTGEFLKSGGSVFCMKLMFF
ncbi:dimethylarginine dimethylaminohydrolase family protein [Rhodothermus marinus]|uniref:dimethylarginine dimethylaminohydrolase family protein n=1 Tax=Rhodothermus marinus TaxID=29549 RepID=UPI0012BA54BC|nr:arginine deiminase family protein [Rhodothermus marinus]BBM70126.1 amidinotransferase [Rhodothermus marinus]BBM73112.1 amidinotransferase [Rhodothermus marinus]